MDEIKRLREIIDGSDNIVFFGGAGVSTESGVPDFRSADGLYNTPDVRFDGYRPEYLLSRDCLEREPAVFFEYYRQKLDARGVEPNYAHKYLARLEAAGKLRAVVTQNIDGLHGRAGSKTVYEIHGTTERNYCSRCLRPYPADFIFNSKEPIPRCSCGGVIRCDFTLYGESLPEDAVEGAVRAISAADVLIIGGTSLAVYPAAGLIDYYRGNKLVLVNLQPTPRDKYANLCIAGKIGEVFSQL